MSSEVASSARVKQDLRKMYDRSAGEYHKAYSTEAGRYFMKRKIETMLRLTRFSRGDRILEIGCADGPYTLELARMGFRMTGVDISPKSIEAARAISEREGIADVSFEVDDAEELSRFGADTYDGVISFSALRYVPQPAKALAAFARVARPGGKVVGDFPNRYCPWFTVIKPHLLHSRHIHDQVFSTGEVRKLFLRAGLTGLDVRRILFTSKNVGPARLRVMRIVDRVGELPGLNLVAAIIMCAGTKPRRPGRSIS